MKLHAINGVVCEWDRKFGVKTSFDDRIVEIVKKCESDKLTPKAENIVMFDELI